MSFGTIWVAAALALGLTVLPQVTGVKHVDIFQQFNDGSFEASQKSSDGSLDPLDEEDIRTEQPTSCVEEVLPTDPLELHEKLENETDIPRMVVQNISRPNLGELFQKLTTGFFSLNLFQIGQHVRGVLVSIKSRMMAYTNDAVAKFEHLRHRTMRAVKRKMDELNEQIRTYFQNEFVEYRDVCLPDEDHCMKLLHAQIDQYEQRLRTNVEECHDKLADHLAEQRREIDAAQQLMGEPYRKMDGCLNRDAGFGRSFLACSGSAVSNLAQLTTASMQSFADRMTFLSSKFTRRVDKFEKCVVKRRQLMKQNEREVVEKSKSCFKKQQSQPEAFF
ncbi:AGAP004334-PA [Anopheles gambiae str. PEST]|uniref:AGAP004334-PA n=2 Tax=gambiae species complex TaxID=44542 RepID=Q9BIH7_ANOGA|nr:AGAP004334-PA [Anopheles gambiae str. PEST]CAC35520.1 gSG5 protein [Anopheles gambiae]